jgi:hypothetical protein
MGRKSNCERKGNGVLIRNLSECQREYIGEMAAIESIRKGRVISQSAIVARIVREKMESDGYACGVE